MQSDGSGERRYAPLVADGGDRFPAGPRGIILWPGRQAAAIMPRDPPPLYVLSAPMRNMLAIAIFLALAVVMILTKPTPQEIVSAATGQMNYFVINKDRMPREFVAAAGAAAVLKTVQDIFSGGAATGPDLPVRWHTRDLVFLTSSDLTLPNFGSLKCVWLLRNGFCIYFSK
jgi:hypothetical protein